MKQSSLGSLARPELGTPKLDVSGQSKDLLLKMLEQMIRIRIVEEVIGDLILNGETNTPCHLGIGQEAVSVGVATVLSSRDRVFGGHRAHAQYLALGGGVKGLLAEVLGRETGASHGLGGSMHLFAGEVGFHGSVPIVAGTISIAVGAALASRLENSDRVAVCFFGDGAAEEGVLHESLNLAAVQQLPVLFVCENNLFSSHLDIEARQPDDRIARFADAHRVHAESIDGNDVLTVAAVAGRLVDGIRSTSRPAFLEAVTFRHRGHVGANEDIDVGVHRTMEDVMAWKKRDPIDRLQEAIIESNIASKSDIKVLYQRQEDLVYRSLDRARCDSHPDSSGLLNYVYKH